MEKIAVANIHNLRAKIKDLQRRLDRANGIIIVQGDELRARNSKIKDLLYQAMDHPLPVDLYTAIEKAYYETS
jgi:hypothetical protein